MGGVTKERNVMSEDIKLTLLIGSPSEIEAIEIKKMANGDQKSIIRLRGENELKYWFAVEESLEEIAKAISEHEKKNEIPSPSLIDKKTMSLMHGSVDLTHHQSMAEIIFDLLEDIDHIRFDFLCHLLEQIRERKKYNAMYASVGIPKK
jgi:hypothetical protein